MNKQIVCKFEIQNLFMTISTQQKIVPFLWFDHQAEEAAKRYTTIFPNSRINSIRHYPAREAGAEPLVMSVNFELQQQLFYGFNGGPHFQFTSAISFFVNCDDQAEVDHYWNHLLQGGRAERCGWLRDAFGVSWQIIPRQLGQYLNHQDPEKAQRALQAMLKMEKIIIKDLD